MDGYVSANGATAEETKASEEPAITPSMLSTEHEIAHLMSVEGGCQTEEQAKAYTASMMGVLNFVAAGAKHKKQPLAEEQL